MKLIHRRNDSNDEYLCELTKMLDSAFGIDKLRPTYYHHYILADKGMIKDKCLAIRIPGRTIGDVILDDNYIITDIEIGDDMIKHYSYSVNNIMKQFIGQKIEMNDL